MKEAIAYIRVSGDEQLKGYSPAAQRKLILDYAKRNEIVVKKENIFDVSESARQEGRKAFNEMLQIFHFNKAFYQFDDPCGCSFRCFSGLL